MEFIPVNTPLLDGNEKAYLNECIETGWISSEGPFVRRLEEGVAAYVGRKYGVAVSNGSVALDLCIEALDLKENDEVIMPAFTIISCAAALVRKRIKPVLVDADSNTWNMDVNQIESKISSRTKAIMVVHIYGLPVDMDAVVSLARKHNLYIIEDAAEAHGLEYKGKKCGSFGDITAMSFYPNKHITTGEGGMVLTDNDKLRERCESLRNLCHIPGLRFHHEEIGHNFRMSNIQAAIGVAQLEKIEEHLKRKRDLGHHYQNLFTGIEGIQLPVVKTGYADNIYWVFGIVLSKDLGINNLQMIEKMKEEGVGCRPFFWPMHKQPVFKKMGLFIDETYPVAERLGEYGFYVPSGLTVDDNQRSFIADRFAYILRNMMN